MASGDLEVRVKLTGLEETVAELQRLRELRLRRVDCSWVFYLACASSAFWLLHVYMCGG